jgi:hypothetical protein
MIIGLIRSGPRRREKLSLTTKQKEVAESLVAGIKSTAVIERVRSSIKRENEYSSKKDLSQKPTREQFSQSYNL